MVVDVIDVDTDSAARVRCGHKIPVLLFDGELVCHGRLDPQRCIRRSRTTADRYNPAFAQTRS